MKDELAERRERRLGAAVVELGPKGLAAVAAAKARDAALARGVPGEPPGVTEARRLLAEGADRILFEQAAIREGYLPADWRERDEALLGEFNPLRLLGAAAANLALDGVAAGRDL